MIGLSRFRTAIVPEQMVKVAYVSSKSAAYFNKTHKLNVDPGYLGTGKVVDIGDDAFDLKVVGVTMEDVLSGSENKRRRAYRWAMDEREPSVFMEQDTVLNANDRMLYLLGSLFSKGEDPDMSVWVLDVVTEHIFSHDDSVTSPRGEYREYRFAAIVNYPLMDESDEKIKDEFVVLVTDL